MPYRKRKLQLPYCDCEDDMENLTIQELRHVYLKVSEERNEFHVLMELMAVLSYKQVVIYVKSHKRCEELSGMINGLGGCLVSTYIDGFMTPKVRSERYKEFVRREGGLNVLLVADCGHTMEFTNIDVAINIDAPENLQVYVHRVSSRHPRKGLVITFIRQAMDIEVLKQVGNLYKVVIEPHSTRDYLDSSTYIED